MDNKKIFKKIIFASRRDMLILLRKCSSSPKMSFFWFYAKSSNYYQSGDEKSVGHLESSKTKLVLQQKNTSIMLNVLFSLWIV